jgi:CBS-domain-containing membrane protein
VRLLQLNGGPNPPFSATLSFASSNFPIQQEHGIIGGISVADLVKLAREYADAALGDSLVASTKLIACSPMSR